MQSVSLSEAAAEAAVAPGATVIPINYTAASSGRTPFLPEGATLSEIKTLYL